MPQAEPFVREAGTGPAVVCIHSNASNSGQWRGLMDLLAPTCRVLAPDSYGSGKSPEWPSDRIITLGDETALIEPVLAGAGSPLALVGHSYGAAVALVAALANPGRVKALALYEPTLFSLLDAEGPQPNEADGIRKAVADAGAALDAGNKDAAAEKFIDYWMGSGSWAKTPEQRKAPAGSGVMIANPPYGERIGESEELARFYPKLGDSLKQNFAGWNCYFFTADRRMEKLIRLSTSRRTVLYNGPIECRLYEFKVVAGSNRP